VVKAAWRVIGKEEQDFKNRCYWLTAELHDPFNQAKSIHEQADVGLVGLHVVYRTAKRPQWIWSSFEHVDNVPEADGPVPGRRYSFNYGTAYLKGDPEPNLDANAPSGEKPGIPAQTRSLAFELHGKLRPTQVQRLQPVHPKTEAANHKYQELLGGTVWQYYKLVVTQFPTQPENDNADTPGVPFPGPGGTVEAAKGAPARVSVANTTMETYYQDRSCMECHSGARGYGVAFLFSLGRPLRASLVRDVARLAPIRGFSSLPVLAPTEAGSMALAAERDRRARAEISDVDRQELDPILRRLTPGTRPQENRHQAISSDRRNAVPEAGATEAVRGPADRTRQEEEKEFQAIHRIFTDLLRDWEKKSDFCPPELEKRHGTAFGWRNGQPWKTWKELKEARFAPPGTKPGDEIPLIDLTKPVDEMLLIRVLTSSKVAEARNKQMPLNGPYMRPEDVKKVREFIQKKKDAEAR
jgi:hypothetical protein